MWHRIIKGHWFKPHYDGGWDIWARLPTVDGCATCMGVESNEEKYKI